MPRNYVRWQDIRQHIPERPEVKKQHGISDDLHKTPSRTPMHALAEPTDKGADVPPPPQVSKIAALEAKIDRLAAAYNRQSPQGGGKGEKGGKYRGKGGGLKFNVKGCWECGEESHSRWECKKKNEHP